jgi:hypothetical protein
VGFEKRYPHPFLVKAPRQGSSVKEGAESFSFETSYESTQLDPFALVWRVVPVVKRAGNPFPDRLSVGRAPNCDVVIRYPFVSKLHAHFLRSPDGSLQLMCLKSRTPLYVNGRLLSEGNAAPVDYEGVIAFGSLKLAMVSASKFYELLRGLGQSSATQ